MGEADEELTVLDARDRDISVAPLARDHVPPRRGISPVYVANLTRNVVIESRSTAEVGRSVATSCSCIPSDVDIRYARPARARAPTSSRPIDDPADRRRGTDWSQASRRNARGRYALHFHRTGTAVGRAPVQVLACALVDSPGWGYVNHSSRVDFDGNVAFNVFGSGFVTEAGDEVGSFRRNLAMRSKGSGEDEVERRADPGLRP